MYNHTLYFYFWCTNALVLFASKYLIPDNIVVLGSWRFSSIESAIYAGFWITFIYWVWWDFAIQRSLSSDQKIVSFIIYSIVNSIAILGVSVFHGVFGFKLENYYWAGAIGFMTTLLQSFVWRMIVKR